MFKKIVLILGIVIVAFLGYAASQPDSFRTERKIVINAPPEKIFPLIDDFQQWSAWSPYEDKDPDMKRTFGAVTVGKGANYAWEGDSNVGVGSMEITESTPPGKILIDLNFLAPMEARNVAEFTLVPEGDATAVTWAIYGPMPFLSKVMSVVVDMDKMIGQDFEVGLATLKTVAEKPTEPAPEDMPPAESDEPK